MEVSEVQREKRAVERKIVDVLREFNNKTGLSVVDIDLVHVFSGEIQPRIIDTHVQVTVKI